MIGSATGGPGREIFKIGEFTKGKITGEQTPAYRVPVLGRFYGETDTKPVISSRFYNNVNQMYKHEQTLNSLKGDPQATMEYIKNYPEARGYKAAEHVEAKINALNAKKKRFILFSGLIFETIGTSYLWLIYH